MPSDATGGEDIMAELLDFTKPHALRNEAEYTAAVAAIDQLLDLDPPFRGLRAIGIPLGVGARL